ncbi:hypothetical protein H261_15210 [Paramagnetospirillum caucaseum]|uniref:Uncharacterized protein n=1 Tax=Paramagnetospirillum caucaseum TaxID=1244869 RepID=M3A8I6_9PROT|nr:hypothetical protein H261_15210 [Paramagnetospirillum caucaseum]
MAVLMPISLPCRSTRAPPELPGLMAASVWMKLWTSEMPTLVRARAETMPWVTVWPTPNGLPTAITTSPTSMASESPSTRVGKLSLPPSILRTARSVRSSEPTMRASNSRRSDSTTVTSSASLITWWLVTTVPSAAMITPEPRERCTRSWPMPGTSPKKRRKNGSANSGEAAARTTRLV